MHYCTNVTGSTGIFTTDNRHIIKLYSRSELIRIYIYISLTQISSRNTQLNNLFFIIF